MNAIEFLKQVNKYELEIKRLCCKISHFDDLAGDMRMGYDERVQNGKADKEPAYAKYVSMKIDAERELKATLDKYHEIYINVESAINAVGGIESVVLFRIYISGEFMSDIAVDLKYSTEGIRKIHERGLEKIEKYAVGI